MVSGVCLGATESRAAFAMEVRVWPGLRPSNAASGGSWAWMQPSAPRRQSAEPRGEPRGLSPPSTCPHLHPPQNGQARCERMRYVPREALLPYTR